MGYHVAMCLNNGLFRPTFSFQALLLAAGPEHTREQEHGKEEVEELIGDK